MNKKLKLLPADEIFQLNDEFQMDSRRHKINGGIGVFLDKNGAPFVLPVVKKAIRSFKLTNFNYLPISGDPIFLNQTAKLFLGAKLFTRLESKIAKQAVVGGTNGLFVWASLFKETSQPAKIIIGVPTWGNHYKIFTYLGFKIIKYQHLDAQGNFNWAAFKNCLVKNPQAAILFHGGLTHNPTGVNPSQEQWWEIAQLIKRSGQAVVFDFAYLGLGEGINKDCFAIRLFYKKNIPVSVVISYSKNMTLYQHRVGGLFVLAKSNQQKTILESHLQYLFRMINSNPPAFGELVVKTILTNPVLKQEWKKSLAKMRASLNQRRQFLAQKSQGRFNFVLKQKGLFSLLGLKPEQIKQLKRKEAIYLLSNSRVNFGGLVLKDIPRFTQACVQASLKSL